MAPRTTSYKAAALAAALAVACLAAPAAAAGRALQQDDAMVPGAFFAQFAEAYASSPFAAMVTEFMAAETAQAFLEQFSAPPGLMEQFTQSL